MSKNNTTLEYKGVSIPIEIHIEKRNGWRASIRKDKVIVRLPRSKNKVLLNTYYDKVKEWLNHNLKKNPLLIERFKLKEYHNSTIDVMERSHSLILSEEDRKTGKVLVKKDIMELTLPQGLNIASRNRLIKKLLSKAFSSVYRGDIEKEVYLINGKYFNEKINSIKLKYNKSNWGSCSSKSNINLSSRLLLVPKKVREYVIIHELSHLIHMNHSKKFWNLVESICPNYKVYEKWLKVHGSSIDF